MHGTDDESVWGQKVETDNHPNFYKGLDETTEVENIEGPGVIEYQQGETGPSPFTVTLHYGEDSDSTFECYPGIETPLPTEDKNGKTIIGWTTSDDGSGDIITAIPTTATSALALYPKIDEFVPNDDGYYEITTVEQLYRFAEIVNTCEESCDFKAKLENDITVNENVLDADGSLNSDADSNFVAWTPIGKYEHSFSGVFDGQGHTISGLYFNEYDEDGLLTTSSVGLFGLVDGSTTSISNVGVKDSYFGTVWGGAGIGGIVGFIDEYSTVNIENAYSKATVVGAIGDSYAGGLVGDFWGSFLTITNSYHAGVVEGASGGVYCGFGGLIGENGGIEISISNSFNYGTVQCSGDYCGALIGYDGAETTVTNSYYLANLTGDDGARSASDFENGTVLAALRDGEGGYVWVQAEGDKYPTIDIKANKNANTIVLDWTSAADSTTLVAAGYTDGAMVIVKDGKQFYADGAIYEGILSAAQVAAIGDKTLYPISGVELETVNGTLVATLNGDSNEPLLISTDVHVDKVIYNRNVQANTFCTIMLPFTLPVAAVSDHSFYKFRRVATGDPDYSYVVKVTSVTTTLKANRPYIMIDSKGSSQIEFVNVEDGLTLNTTAESYEASSTADGITWKMKGVYEYKQWQTGDSEIGRAYLFTAQALGKYKIGQFAKLASGASLRPMRMYLTAETSSPNGGLNRPSRYGISSIVMPENIGIEIEDEELDESVEETTVVKRITIVPMLVQSNRWFDMKGRALNGRPTAKGTYYYNGKRIIIK